MHSTIPLIQEKLNDIRSDVHSGATEMAKKGAECLIEFSQICPAQNPKEFWRELIALSKNLVQSQRSMASLFNLSNQVLLEVGPLVSREPDLKILRARCRAAAQNFTQQAEKALEKIAEISQSLIPSSAVVLTHSSSRTIVGILRKALGLGKSVRAIVTESRPHCEGRELARHLGQWGIPTQVILDAAIAQFLGRADIAFVGADSLSSETFMNKVGTRALALAAQEQAVPLYCACPSGKILPKGMQTHLAPEEGAEVVLEEWSNVHMIMPFFEEIPSKYLSGVITEKGIFKPAAFMKTSTDFPVCQELLAEK